MSISFWIEIQIMSRNMNNHIHAIDNATYSPESDLLDELIILANLSDEDRQKIGEYGANLVKNIRTQSAPGLMEVFLAEYGLSTDEGIALMCLAEALLRVPDASTIDSLIEDKIAPSDWAKHMGHSTSPLVNASTWALMLTGKVLQKKSLGPVGHLHSIVKRLGEPVIRKAVNQAMKEMGRQFVLGENIQAAITRAERMEKKGYTYSYDMLGEAARTNEDAESYYLSYSHAISEIAKASKGKDIRKNPGISVKLSALFPRYELAQRDRVITELAPKLQSLALLAKSAGIGLTVDAEEADRLTLSLEVIEQVLSGSALADWDGFGVVVQAYGQRAGLTITTLYQLAEKYNRRITIRLVKGAYWDSEIKNAQINGMSDFPVFTSKAATDISYIANARLLLGMTDRIYPQFATHNAHTVAAIIHMGTDKELFEFQRLHGMGEQLHSLVKEQEKTRCRIYAPVGAHQDLLAYLVRRLLENGANSSFVNQVVDEEIPPETVVADPFNTIQKSFGNNIKVGTALFQPERPNSQGWDLNHWPTLEKIEQAREPFHNHIWQATPLIAKHKKYKGNTTKQYNPAIPSDHVADVQEITDKEIESALSSAKPWNIAPNKRTNILNKAADLYEAHFGELFALLTREAGKTLPDAISEIREAVDFMRYYAVRASDKTAVGVFACIAPWNFPLAIFTGQVSAALATGNSVLAKPAEQTPVMAWRLIQLLHEAGVPKDVIQLIPGGGAVGAKLTSDNRVDGIAFTGSTDTAQLIRHSMAKNLNPGAPFIAETGGLNAMIVDSTALPEQAVQAIVESAFQSAGQRCSALRCLYVQEDIAEHIKAMLFGAMDELALNDPWLLSTDSGPLIDQQAYNTIEEHVSKAEAEGRLLKHLKTPEQGTFFGPVVIQINGIEDLDKEIFGPVLHIATFKAEEINDVIDNINDTGYGLTFGLQTRIDDRVQNVCERIKAGNIYINRNQIGAIVGSQPFGGHGLSGTGPKAGGPHYLERFYTHEIEKIEGENTAAPTSIADLQEMINSAVKSDKRESLNLPGPTGESNHLSWFSRPPTLCFGPGKDAVTKQAYIVNSLGGTAVECYTPILTEEITELEGFSGVIWWGDNEIAREIDQALANKKGGLIPLITGKPDTGHVVYEQHVCIDTTASGGNAELLSSTS
jgi:RHH-type proline utilization regulon transcriptional repressor/proline dehydrogenase/delta 1-pyrroline-5-carboxylate dehydrogenase